MSILGDAADVNSVIKFLPHTCNHPGYCTAEVGNPGGTCELPCRINRARPTKAVTKYLPVGKRNTGKGKGKIHPRTGHEGP